MNGGWLPTARRQRLLPYDSASCPRPGLASLERTADQRATDRSHCVSGFGLSHRASASAWETHW